MQEERITSYVDVYHYCGQKFEYTFSALFFVMAAYTMGVLYLVPITIMIINYGRMTYVLMKSIKDSSELGGNNAR